MMDEKTYRKVQIAGTVISVLALITAITALIAQ